MAERLADTIAKIKSGINKRPKAAYATTQVDFDAMFIEHAERVCPGFKSNHTIDFIKFHFLQLANGKTKKGLYVHGTVGVGKSTIFRIFKSMGRQIYSEFGKTTLWFSDCTAPWLVNEKMASVAQGYGGNFNYEAYTKGKLYIDDLGMEPLCFNSYELLTKLLFERHRKGSTTFVSSNMTPQEVLKRYGPQIFDRMGEMFEIVEWDGKSLRP